MFSCGSFLYLGEDQHFQKERPLHLDLDPLLDTMSTHSYVGLETPPRVLTLEDRPFPNLGENPPVQPQFDEEDVEMLVDKKSHNVSFTGQNGYVPQTPPRHPG